ncbi:hypothetical protein J6590_008442 [Homalodisca vitripennis]|nr:hypothetical protein J6590_008442 [Homalodisca vitripennis]
MKQERVKGCSGMQQVIHGEVVGGVVAVEVSLGERTTVRRIAAGRVTFTVRFQQLKQQMVDGCSVFWCAFNKYNNVTDYQSTHVLQETSILMKTKAYNTYFSDYSIREGQDIQQNNLQSCCFSGTSGGKDIQLNNETMFEDVAFCGLQY